jgi:hypothetical protein
MGEWYNRLIGIIVARVASNEVVFVSTTSSEDGQARISV